MQRPVGDLVDVRCAPALPWLPGTVRSVNEGAAQDCYGVELNAPVSANTWSGVVRRYGGTELVGTAVNLVFVHEHVEKIVPYELIKDQGA